MRSNNSEVKRWQLRLYELGMEADNSLGGLRMYYPLMPPNDPEELEHQRRIRVEYGIYTHLAWLFVNELRTLRNLASIQDAQDALESRNSALDIDHVHR